MINTQIDKILVPTRMRHRQHSGERDYLSTHSRWQYRHYIIDLYGVYSEQFQNCAMPSLFCLLSLYTIRISLIQRIINPRRACAARVTVVVVSVCLSVFLSVKSNLTSSASVRPENAATYSTCNKGQNICGVFSENASFQSYVTSGIVRLTVQSAIFSRRNTCVRF